MSINSRPTDAPVPYQTPQRKGQSGEDAERRPGPNPRSSHATGPHAPYEPTDSGGLAAEKHNREPAAPPDDAPEAGTKPDTGIEIVDLSRHKT